VPCSNGSFDGRPVSVNLFSNWHFCLGHLGSLSSPSRMKAGLLLVHQFFCWVCFGFGDRSLAFPPSQTSFGRSLPPRVTLPPNIAVTFIPLRYDGNPSDSPFSEYPHSFQEWESSVPRVIFSLDRFRWAQAPFQSLSAPSNTHSA